MKSEDLRKETDEQLKLDLLETEKHLFKLRFQSATDRLETPSEIRKAKKDIARIKTEQRHRELQSLAKLPDDEIASKLSLAQAGEVAAGQPFVGRRKAVRVAHRMTAIQSNRPAAPTAAKGK